MAEFDKMPMQKAHIHFGKECFNQAWDRIEKQNRTQADEDTMIHLAHASIYHWTQRADCMDQNLSIGFWQLSRVYALAGLGACALRSAQTCLSHSEQDGVATVFLGYAHEALARSYAVLGDSEQSASHIQAAKDIAITLPDDDREQLLGDMADIA